MNAAGRAAAMAVLASARADSERQVALEIQRARFRAVGLPARYQAASWADFTAELPAQAKLKLLAQRYAGQFEKHRAIGRCLTFLGKVGTGKTLLASLVAADVYRAGFSCRYTTLAQMAGRIREAVMGDGSEGVALGEFTAPDLLVLDEIGLQSGSDFELRAVGAVCGARYDAGTKPVVFIGNVTEADLPAYLGDRVVDRAADRQGVTRIFNWASFRRRAAR